MQPSHYSQPANGLYLKLSTCLLPPRYPVGKWICKRTCHYNLFVYRNLFNQCLPQLLLKCDFIFLGSKKYLEVFVFWKSFGDKLVILFLFALFGSWLCRPFNMWVIFRRRYIITIKWNINASTLEWIDSSAIFGQKVSKCLHLWCIHFVYMPHSISDMLG